MGLIRAGLNAVGGTLASQWKEYFYLDAMPDGVLAAKANKKTKGRFDAAAMKMTTSSPPVPSSPSTKASAP